MKRFKTVDDFMDSHEMWAKPLEKLREILLTTELNETVKWGFPVYTKENKNLVGLGAFKSYTGLWFFQGGLLTDKNGVLINAQEGKTKAMRQWRFGSIDEINADLILDYVYEAIANHDAGREIKAEKNKALVIPSELETAFMDYNHLKEKFEALSLSKKRDYCEHIGGAKRGSTRISRLEKSIPMILSGVGLNDKYLKC